MSGDARDRFWWRERSPDNESLMLLIEGAGECEWNDACEDGRDAYNCAPKIDSRRRISAANSLASAAARAL